MTGPLALIPILAVTLLQTPPAPPTAGRDDAAVRARAEVRSLLVEEMPRRALEVLRPWLASHPEDAGFHALHGEVHYALEDHASAAAAFERAIAIDPSYRGKLFHYGRSLLALDRTGEALEVFAAMMETDQVTLQVRGSFGQGLAHQAEGDDVAARAAFERTLALDPDFIRATYRIALIDIAAGEDARAEVALRKVLAEDRLHHGAAYNRALALERLGRADEAEVAWERYRAILEGKQRISLLRDRLAGSPGDFATFLELGDLHAELGVPREAAQWFARAAALDPFDPRPAVGTVAALRALGRTEDAERLCRMLLERDRPIEALRVPLIELLEARGATDEANRWRASAPKAPDGDAAPQDGSGSRGG